MDPTSLSIVSLTGMVLLGTVLGYKVGVYKGKVDKILPLLEALEQIREDHEDDEAFDKLHKQRMESEAAKELPEDQGNT
jgi:hypothetical protein